MATSCNDSKVRLNHTIICHVHRDSIQILPNTHDTLHHWISQILWEYLGRIIYSKYYIWFYYIWCNKHEINSVNITVH